MGINCANCTGVTAETCTSSFDLTKAAVDDNADSVLMGNLLSVTQHEDGSVELKPIEQHSEVALKGASMIRSLFVENLALRQTAIGCTLTRELIEQKLNTR